MKRTNRWIAMLLTVVMVLGLLTGAVFADEGLGNLEGKTVILHSNDVHGAIEGYAKMAGLKEEFEAAGADVILADAGDYSQGTTYVSVSKGATAVEMMNQVGYDVVTLGNHEFDYGYAQLKKNMESAAFKVLCADVFENGKTIFDANTIIEKDGVKIGFFGLETPEAQTKSNPALIQGLSFAATDKLYEVAQAQVDALEAQGADLIVALTHLGVDNESVGNRSYDVYENTTGIDIMIDGHSHTVMTEGEENEPIQSTGTAFANVGAVVIDNATKTVEDNYLISIDENTSSDADVAAAAQKIIDEIKAEYGKVFAHSDVDLDGVKAHVRSDDTNLSNLITDALLWTATKETGSISVPPEDIVVITNGGGIRASISAGDISKNDVNTVLPFGNTVSVVYVTGEQLLEALEASTYTSPEAIGGFPQIAGMDITIHTSYYFDEGDLYPGSTYHAPASIQRVGINDVGGKPFNLKKTYAVVTNNFVAAGGDTYYVFGNSDQQFDTGIPMDEALMAYITEVLDGNVGEKYAEAQDRVRYTDRIYDDVPTDAYYSEAATVLTEYGILSGYGNFTFGPKDYMTRGQFACMLAGDVGGSDCTLGSEIYSDVPEDSYYDAAIGLMTEYGILYGVGDGKFNPDAPITREQIAAILYRTVQDEDLNYMLHNQFVDGDPDITTATDYSSISAYAVEAMDWCVDSGIIFGTSMDSLTLNPRANATRAEVVTMLYRLITLSPAE